MKAIFDTHNADTEFNHRSGETVTIIRTLTYDEADINEVGMMYLVEFEDGETINAFEDELKFI